MLKMNNKEMLLENARKVTDKIYDKMRVVEECHTIAENVADKKVAFIADDNQTIVDVTRVLTEDQMQIIKNMAVIAIKGNAEDAENWLEQIARFEPESKKVEDNEMDPEEKQEPEKNKKVVALTVKNVSKMINDGLTHVEIAEKTGVSKSTIGRFLKENGLTKTREKAKSPSKEK